MRAPDDDSRRSAAITPAPPASEEEAKARQQLALTKAGETRRSATPADLGQAPSPSFAAMRSETFVGPLPPPSMLREYEQAHAGLGGTLIEAWKSESNHRRGLEKADQDLSAEIARGQLANQSRGVFFAFVLGLTGLVGAIVLGGLGHDASAAVIAGIDIVGLAAVSITGTRRRRGDSQGERDHKLGGL